MELLPFTDRCVKIITAPSEFFKAPLDKNIIPGIVHFVIVLAISSVLATIGSVVSGIITAPLALLGASDASAAVAAVLLNLGATVGGAIVLLPVMVLVGIPLGIVLMFIGTGVSHVFLYLLGARGGWERTFKIGCYVTTFNLVIAGLSILPFFGPVLSAVVGLYVLYVTIQAYSLQHQMTMLNAALGALLPAIIAAMIGLLVAGLAVLLGGSAVLLAFLANGSA